MLLTSNRAAKQWDEIFSDSVLAQAAIDRIFDRAQIIVFKGKSYRLKGKIKFPQLNILKHIR